MAKKRNVAALGIAAAAVIFSKFIIKAVAFAAAFFATQSAVSFFTTPEEEREMKGGFEEVSEDWNGFLDVWRDSTEMTFRRWGARVAALYVTEDEVLALYGFRASLFEQVAPDPRRNVICSGMVLADSTITAEGIDLTPVTRLMGRGFARMHEGRQAWVAPVDLMQDEDAWAAFGEYAVDHGLEDVVDGLVAAADGTPMEPSEMCRLQAHLYRAARDHPQDRVGDVRLIDFVRAMDALAANGGG